VKAFYYIYLADPKRSVTTTPVLIGEVPEISLKLLVDSLSLAVVMFHIYLALETILTGLCHLWYDSAPPMSPLRVFRTINPLSISICHC
jgi:hypothetical protein